MGCGIDGDCWGGQWDRLIVWVCEWAVGCVSGQWDRLIVRVCEWAVG